MPQIFSMLKGYYTEKLAGERLRACYDLATPRVKAYLEAEIAVVLERTTPSTIALELGCGYGRVLERVAPHVRSVVGIDTSLASLSIVQEFVDRCPSAYVLAMDATRMLFRDQTFDLTFCIQNGICAFGVDQATLVREAVRVTRPGGTVLFSSYAESFWPHRLEWFEAQAAHGLIGPIDKEATGNGVIVCRDGFRAATMAPRGFEDLAARLSLPARIYEVEGSSVFCEIAK